MATTIFSPASSPSRTTCATLLAELQKIWDEIGESETERDKMLLQLEQECLDNYRRKVDVNRKRRADLLQSLAESEAEISSLISALGETSSFSQGKGTLKQQLSAIKPGLEALRLKKQGRIKEFNEPQSQITRICSEIAVTTDSTGYTDPQVDENDLTIKRLGKLKLQLTELQNEKNLRLQEVDSNLSIIHDLSVAMSIDFCKTVSDVDPSLIDPKNGKSKSISNDTLAQLTSVIHSLKQEKQQRLQKLHGLGCRLKELWDLMDTPLEEQRKWECFTSLISTSEDEVSRPGCLALEVIEQAEIEVERLNVLKSSKLKELIFKRQNELEVIYSEVHMDIDGKEARKLLARLTESGDVDLAELLSNMDDQIRRAKEQALSRKDILDKVERWKCAYEEEQWLDEYERDENRYNAGRGAHKNLKRAEKARIMVSKTPSLVDNLIARVKAWELDKGIPFLYDKMSLLEILEDYLYQRQQREEEKRRSREQKRQEQSAAEQEALYGSRPKKPLGQNTSANTMTGTPIARRLATPSRHVISSGKNREESNRYNNATPVNYVALHKDDLSSRSS